VATFIKELVLELPEGEEVPFRAGRLHPDRVPAHEVNYKDFDIEERVPRRLGQVQHVEVRLQGRRAGDPRLLHGQLPRRAGIIMLNVRIASPPPAQPDVPPGIMSSYIFGLKPGDEVTSRGRSASSSPRTPTTR
jgi:Na+-transporting NADH:ubiquinone oxidoreductase subunit F